VIRWFHFTWLMIFRSRFCVFIGVWPLHIFHCRHIFNSFHTSTRQTPEEILLPWLTSRYASRLVLKCTVQNSTWDGCGCFNLFVYHHLIGYRHHLIYLCTKQAHRANDGLDIAFRLLDPSRSSSPPYPTDFYQVRYLLRLCFQSHIPLCSLTIMFFFSSCRWTIKYWNDLVRCDNSILAIDLRVRNIVVLL